MSELKKAATNPLDHRHAASAWELFICYFDEFEVDKNWNIARRWLTDAAMHGLVVAQAYFLRPQAAMGADPFQLLSPFHGINSEATSRSTITAWLKDAISLGHVDVMADLKQHQHDSSRGSVTVGSLLNKVARQTNDSAEGISLSNQFIEAASLGNLQKIRTFASDLEPKAFNAVDLAGNSATIQAAKSGHFEVLDHLLKLPSLNVAHCNHDDQSVLHYTLTFEKEQLQRLVPLMVERCVPRRAVGNIFSGKRTVFAADQVLFGAERSHSQETRYR